MYRAVAYLTVAVVAVAMWTSSAAADGLRGTYLEARTCQVYTGPCFANSEIGITGKDAMMAWNIEAGKQDGIDLAGLNVVAVINTKESLAHQGIAGAGDVKSIILVDERATPEQQEALASFARNQMGPAGKAVLKVETSPIEMTLDTFELTGSFKAGKTVELTARKARPGDCICSNEAAYYPPLCPVQFCAPGVAEEGSFSGRGLGVKWDIPGARSAYLATFAE